LVTLGVVLGGSGPLLAEDLVHGRGAGGERGPDLVPVDGKLIAATCASQGIGRGQLTIHADRGSSMTSKPVALLLADLGVTQSHSRPHVSNDNPYSEAQFKTLKYRPGFPARIMRPRCSAARRR
jgi:hypothetical protein